LLVDDSESVLLDKAHLVRIWSDGLCIAKYRKALPFLDLTWSIRTLRSNLDWLAAWERDADVKAKVNAEKQQRVVITVVSMDTGEKSIGKAKRTFEKLKMLLSSYSVGLLL